MEDSDLYRANFRGNPFNNFIYIDDGPLPLDPNDPIFEEAFEHTFPPMIAYLHMPPGKFWLYNTHRKGLKVYLNQEDL